VTEYIRWKSTGQRRRRRRRETLVRQSPLPAGRASSYQCAYTCQ